MGTLEFVAAIVWQVSIVIVAVLYRRAFLDLLAAGLTRFRAGPFEMAWEDAKSSIDADITPEPVSSVRSVDDDRAPGRLLLEGDLAGLATNS